MKNLYLLICISIAWSKVYAQPILTSNNTIPVIGETFNYNASTVSSNPGSDGADQTWDLSALGNTQQYTASVLSSVGSSHPNSNYKISLSSGDEFYYNSSVNNLSLVGIETPSVSFPYNNPEQQLSFPMEFGTTFTDTWSTVFTNGMTYYRNGFTNVTADSYGTLILPNDTFTNILRVQVTQDYSDSVPGIGVLMSYLNTTYYYYQPNLHLYLAIISDLISVDNSGSVSQQNSIGYLNSVPLNTNDLENSSISIYPNPTKGKFNLKLSNVAHDKITFILMDINGKPIPFKLTQSGSEYKFEPNQIINGIYWLNVYKDDRRIATKKIQVVN